MNSLKGQLLIATPQLLAPIFTRSVILMLEHNEEGAMGVILNQPINTTITDLAGKIFEDGFEWDKPLSLGGPVPGPLMVLHTFEELADAEVLPGIFHTLEASRVQEIIRLPARALADHRQLFGLGTGTARRRIRLGFLAHPARPRRFYLLGRERKSSGKWSSTRSTPRSSPSSSNFATCRRIRASIEPDVQG